MNGFNFSKLRIKYPILSPLVNKARCIEGMQLYREKCDSPQSSVSPFCFLA